MKLKYYILGICLIAFCTAPAACSKTEDEDIRYVPRTEIGGILDNSAGVARIFRDTSFLVAVGVEETDLHLQTIYGYVQQVHLIKVDTKVPGVKLKVAMPDNNNDISGGWKRQTLTDMATRFTAPRARVAAMVNGDFWDMTTPINPRGPVHRGGTIISSEWDFSERVPQQALSFIAVKNDGSFLIDYSAEYEALKHELKECTGAGVVFLKDGKYPGGDYQGRDPRTSIGYTKDGIVYLMTVDGRKKFGAAGMTYMEMSDILGALGCDRAANLDGGGSAQMLIRHPIANVYQIRNSPADGAERPVVNAWAVIVDEP